MDRHMSCRPAVGWATRKRWDWAPTSRSGSSSISLRSRARVSASVLRRRACSATTSASPSWYFVFVAATEVAVVDHVRCDGAGWDVHDEVADPVVGRRADFLGEDGQRRVGDRPGDLLDLLRQSVQRLGGASSKVRLSLFSCTPMIKVPPSTANEDRSRASSLLSPLLFGAFLRSR